MSKRFNIGLKLFSINTESIDEAKECWDNNVFSYIELYIIPTSFQETIQKWEKCDIPIMIHAPHSLHGMNLARQEQTASNRELFVEVQKFADVLHGEIIIVHGGHTGTIEETINQVGSFADQRIYLENKPRVGLHDEQCVGYSPAEFTVASESGVFGGYVLDFGHAACAALSMGTGVDFLIGEFLKFGPEVFHLSDGYSHWEKDSHLNFGKGEYELSRFLSFLPEGKRLTIETPRNPETGLRDFVEDVEYLENL